MIWEIAYGLFILVAAAAAVLFVAFAITFVLGPEADIEFGFSIPERLPGLDRNDLGVPQEPAESGSAFDTAPRG